MSTSAMIRVALASLALVALPLTLVASAGTASAHERRSVGKYTFVVGWLGEPALVGEPNGIDLRITTTATNEPVAGAEKTLKAELTQGGAKKEFTLRSRFGVPGGYTSDIIPTRAGQYQFRFTGDIAGDKVEEIFESGPGRFDDVNDTARLEFPIIRAASAAPAVADTTAVNRQIATLDAALKETQDAASAARLLGVGGLFAGIVGAAAAFLAMRQSGSRA